MDYFRQCSCLETNPCVLFFTIPWLSKKLLTSQLPNLDLDSLFSRFYGLVRTKKKKKKSMNGLYKTNIDCSFIWGIVENYCTQGKIQPWPTIHWDLYSRSRLNFTSGTIIFHHSPPEQSIFVVWSSKISLKSARFKFL